MSSKKKNILKISIFMIIILISTFCILIGTNKSKTDINNVLRSEYYSYLPLEAKNYIKEVYEETGEVILTEKNKEENIPYLNPAYVEYISLSQEEKEEVAIIPDVYVVDFLYEEAPVSSELPSSYDLRNVNGQSYITELKNQDSTGLCWAFSTLEQTESLLMVQNETPYTNSSEKFSSRQLDYATSTNGILNYENPFGRRELGSGGNANIATEIMSYGISVFDDSKMPFNTNMGQKELYEVINYNDAKYEVNSTIDIPSIGLTLTMDENYFCQMDENYDVCYDEYAMQIKNNYINIIKESIMQNGGIIVATISPQSNCGFENNPNEYLISVNDRCFETTKGHGMHVIGWDDNYEYSYCDTGEILEKDENGTCTKGKLIEGQGAFLLRNSWGEEVAYPYLTYDSIYDGIYSASFEAVSSISSMSERSWDNVYPSHVFTATKLYAAKKLEQKIIKEISGSEKIEKIKFYNLVQNAEYTLTIETKNDTYVIDDKINVELPGIYTVDLSNENIIIDEDEYTVTISSNKAYLRLDSASVFTSNIDNTPIIKTKDVEMSDSEVIINSKTKNIESGQSISYSLYDGDTELIDYLDIENNIVGANEVNAKIKVKKSLPSGEYILKTSYNNYYYESKINVLIEGKGTIDDPFIITNEDELKMINNNLSAYYRLGNDINLTENWIPIGTLENPFSGGFDGNNYKITGLEITDEELDSVGLFGYVANNLTDEVYIKNVTIKDANISGINEVGILLGHLKIKKGAPVTIEKVFIVGGNLTGKTAGALIANIENNFNLNAINQTKINAIYSSANIVNSEKSGLIGINNCLGCHVSFTNIQNTGITISEQLDFSYDSNMSFSSSNSTNSYEIQNFIFTGLTKTPNRQYSHITVGNDINGINGYYLNTRYNTWDHTNEEANINKVSLASALTEKTQYTSWKDFNDYWVVELVDNIPRIPVLKGVEFEYTKVNDIEVKVGGKLSLLNYISPITDVSKINFEVAENENKINVYYTYEDSTNDQKDIIIEGINGGTTTLKIISNHDGYENDINVKIIGEEKLNIYFNSNFENNEEKVQEVIRDIETNLLKNNFVREGYKFVGWNTKADGTGASYSDEQLINISSDLRLYAQWEKSKYTLKFDANGGTGTMSNQEFDYETLQKITKNSYTKKGYKFKEWNTKQDGTGISYVDEKEIKLTENLTLYAIWEKELYSVTFDANEGNFKDNKNIIVVEEWEDSKLDSLEQPTRNGYIFKGYYTDKIGGTRLENYIAEAGIDKDGLVFYAQWKKSKYTLKFDANGGSGTMNNQEFVYDTSQKISKNLYSKSGYKFKGWNTKKDGTGISYLDEKEIKLTENLILYAQWEETYSYKINKYSVDNDKKYIDKIEINTSVDDFKKNINLNVGYSVDVDYKTINGKNLLYTGGKTKIYKNNKLYVEYTNIIIGDINGDGSINSADLLKIRQHLLKTISLLNVYFTASDINYDKTINSADLLRVRQHLLGTKPIM